MTVARNVGAFELASREKGCALVAAAFNTGCSRENFQLPVEALKFLINSMSAHEIREVAARR